MKIALFAALGVFIFTSCNKADGIYLNKKTGEYEFWNKNEAKADWKVSIFETDDAGQPSSFWAIHDTGTAGIVTAQRQKAYDVKPFGQYYAYSDIDSPTVKALLFDTGKPAFAGENLKAAGDAFIIKKGAFFGVLYPDGKATATNYIELTHLSGKFFKAQQADDGNLFRVIEGTTEYANKYKKVYEESGRIIGERTVRRTNTKYILKDGKENRYVKP